jgi:hypothetical protein
MKRWFKISIKQIGLLLLFVNIYWISCCQSKIEGVYINQIDSTSTFEIKIKNIDDTLIYYELFEINPRNKYISENKTMGVAKSKGKEFDFLYSLSFYKKFRLQQIQNNVLYIDPLSVDFYPTFKSFGGKYVKKSELETIFPSYSNFFRDNCYYQYRIDKPGEMILYNYPVVSNKKKSIQLIKGSEVRSLFNVYDCKTNEDSFYYIKIRQGREWLNGWAKATDFYKFYFLWKVRNGYKEIKPKF